MNLSFPIETKIKGGLVLIIIFLALLFLFGPIYTIDASERGVLLTWGRVSSDAIEPGIHFKMPFVQSVAKFNIQTQKYEADASAASRDLQIVNAKIAVNYHLRPEMVPSIYASLGYDYGDKVIQPQVQETLKAVTARYSADQLITDRSAVAEAVQTLLRDRLKPYGIYVETTAMTNFDFSKSFNDAIEAKVTAQQQKQKAEMDLQRIRVEADQKIVSAKAEAESLRVQREALTSDLLELRKIEVQKMAVEKWDGKLPTYVTGDGIPLIGIGARA